jgi:hypothetical protein
MAFGAMKGFQAASLTLSHCPSNTFFHPDCTVGSGFSPDLLTHFCFPWQQKWALAGLAC